MVGYLQMLYQISTFVFALFLTSLNEDIKSATPKFHKRSMHNIIEYLKLGYQDMLFNFFDWIVFGLFLILYDKHFFSRYVFGTGGNGLLLEDWDRYS
jgi:hypothetical protein